MTGTCDLGRLQPMGPDETFFAAPVQRTLLRRSELQRKLNRHERKESERFRGFTYEDLIKPDKLNLDIFWLKDESLEDSANLADPDVIACIRTCVGNRRRPTGSASSVHRNRCRFETLML